ncbi:hypothetical protein BT96DRAFT_957972 [Gymnopus androsaceus JB14]|uniref:CxC2-like cysteine cluster KDZ transposase-associated domain-containing protein n=1 Tax=Gymnopus androsaceus JB14 TaxID=1447944 RepID=A0A6A4HJ83_9AGAR|nr:hypothetical protein BT96DRAFT_957972 [Gymnopus androsaceus JB14]
MTLQGKVTTYNFYAGLEKPTDNTGVGSMKDWYKAFARMMREWQHLKMAKHAGRGNDATHIGELAIPCIACPRPGVNLPDDWKEAPKSKRCVSLLDIFAINACFRLKRHLVSSEARDPDLDSGMSYFTEDALFRKFLLGVTDQREMLTCTGLAALDHANTKYSRGYVMTGVGLGVCARHKFFQKNGVVDLQKGEWYANMDYAYASLLRHHDPNLTKVTSYNIVCQWYKNLVARLHIYGHQLFCQLQFSLNWLWGAGRTDGEGVERGWSGATSTQDMGPGSRHGTMNNHFGHWNWIKLTGLGACGFL